MSVMVYFCAVLSLTRCLGLDLGFFTVSVSERFPTCTQKLTSLIARR